MRIRIHAVLALGGVAVLTVAATGCSPEATPANTVVESRTFDFSGNSLTVKSDSADLELVAADVKDVQVTRQVSGTKVGGEVEAGWKLEGGSLELAVDCTGLSVNCGAKYTVKIPSDVAVTVENDKGLVEASGFTADFTAKADDMRLSDLSGPHLDLEGRDGTIEGDGISAESVTVASRNGNNELRFASVPDLVDARSQDGDVRLSLPEAKYAVDTAAKKGDITVDVAKDDTSDHAVRIHTRNGDIVIGTRETP
ncbi:DUF4097 family beta strand repeat-containing protein [Streptomyces sp. NPDC048330]|uniref:DUF4097 family beta strand repeat-containing protein n=1 Tax=Streptomyces sp. NPDC048330 TaxID=3365533 RepID=UPI0037200D96